MFTENTVSKDRYLIHYPKVRHLKSLLTRRLRTCRDKTTSYHANRFDKYFVEIYVCPMTLDITSTCILTITQMKTADTYNLHFYIW